jgi:ElaB/YqjD/DUF883 family membrane-anchored ribosome-binding protein
MTTDPEQIRADIERTRYELSRDVDELGDRVRPGTVARRQTDRARAGIMRMRERVMGTAESTTNRATDSVRDAASSVGDAVSSAPQTVRQQTQGNPLAAGLVAFGVGLLAGSVLRASQKEAEAAAKVKEAAEPLVEDLKEAGSAVADEMRGPVQENVQALRESATEVGRDVAEHSKHAASDVKDEARGDTDETRDYPRTL